MALSKTYRLSSIPLDTSKPVGVVEGAEKWILSASQWQLYLAGVELLLRQVSDILPQLVERSYIPYVAYVNQFLKSHGECRF